MQLKLKKRFLLSLMLLLCTVLLSAKDFRCTFVYKVAFTSGTGKCSEGKEPVVSVDFEHNRISFPDFVFTEERTIPEYTVTEIEMTEKSDGTIELSKGSFEVSQDGKSITGKKLYGTIRGDMLELEVILKVGAMPFNMKIDYASEVQ